MDKLERAADAFCREYNLVGDDETLPAKATFRAGWQACASEYKVDALTDLVKRWNAIAAENARLRAALENARFEIEEENSRFDALEVIKKALEQ